MLDGPRNLLKNRRMRNNLSALENLAWLADMGADEALSETPGMVHWRPAKAVLAEKEKVQEKQRVVDFAPVRAVAESAPKTRNLTAFSPPKAANLDELRDEIARFEGCDLKAMAMNLVFADGNPASSIMVLGDVPAEEEDRSGVPFVGPAGQLLDRMLAAIGLDRTSVYLSNLVFWRPPGNRTPSEVEIEACLPFVYRHIDLVKPKLLILLGATVTKSLLRTSEPFSKRRGKWTDLTLPTGEGEGSPIRCMPLYHPSYLLKQPAAKRQAWADLQEIMKVVNELSD